jgi:hypothetical protein
MRAQCPCPYGHAARWRSQRHIDGTETDAQAWTHLAPLHIDFEFGIISVLRFPKLSVFYDSGEIKKTLCYFL